MGNFLDEARRVFASGRTGQKRDSFERVFSAIGKLQNVHSKADIDIHNIESVFTTFEMAKTLKKFPGAEVKDIDELIEDLKWVIVITLEETVRFQYLSDRTLRSHVSYALFVKIISEAESKGNNSVAILTFNYDVSLDMACALSRMEVDYGLDSPSPVKTGLPLLKLHGSINWRSDKKNAEKIIPLKIPDLLNRLDWGSLSRGDVTIPIGTQFNTIYPSQAIDALPVIVPPSWNKADSHRSVAAVWARAALEMSQAENIYVIGYSLPATDSFFKQLYALGTVGENVLKRFWVFNPDKSRKDIFDSMLGPGAKQRFEFLDTKFSESLQKLKSGLQD